MLRPSKQSLGTSAWLFLAAEAGLGCFKPLQPVWLPAWECCPSRVSLLVRLWVAFLPSVGCLPLAKAAACFLLPGARALEVSAAGVALSVSCWQASRWEVLECPLAACTGAADIEGRPGAID